MEVPPPVSHKTSRIGFSSMASIVCLVDHFWMQSLRILSFVDFRRFLLAVSNNRLNSIAPKNLSGFFVVSTKSLNLHQLSQFSGILASFVQTPTVSMPPTTTTQIHQGLSHHSTGLKLCKRDGSDMRFLHDSSVIPQRDFR